MSKEEVYTFFVGTQIVEISKETFDLYKNDRYELDSLIYRLAREQERKLKNKTQQEKVEAQKAQFKKFLNIKNIK